MEKTTTTLIVVIGSILNRLGHKTARKGVKMVKYIGMALVAAIALCAFTGCSDPGGNAQGNVGLFPLNTEQACTNVPEDDTELTELCADLTGTGLKATLTPPAKDSNGDGTNDATPISSDLASTDVDGSTALAFSFADVTPNTVYGFTVDEDGLPARCHLESDGMDHLESTVNFGDEESLEPKVLDLVCSPKEEQDTDTINVVVDGGINMDDICPYVGAVIKAKAFDGSEPADSEATPLAGVTFVLSGPLAQYEELFGDDFSPTCTTTAEEPTCTFECLLPTYHSVTVTAENFEGVIWDHNGLDLEAGQTYDLQFNLSPETDHPENSLVDFPGFNMAEGTTMNGADMGFARYDADENAVPIPADEATYEVLTGMSVTISGGDVDAGADGGVEAISGDVAVLTAVEVGQTHIQRCWTGFEPNPCQTFVVTVY